MEVKTKMEAQYEGHSIKKNGDLDLKFKLAYSEIISALKLVRMINTNISISAKVGSKKPMKLGIFALKNLSIDRDGESKVTFNSEVDTVEFMNFIELAERETIIHLMCVAEVDEDEDD